MDYKLSIGSPMGSDISVGSPSPPLQHNSSLQASTRKRKSSETDQLKTISNKGFSIADILGSEKREEKEKGASTSTTSSAIHIQIPAAINLANLQPPPMKLMRPWDHLLPVQSFIPATTLLPYEYRLALDYQRQLQEHLNIQAQLFRHIGSISNNNNHKEPSSTTNSVIKPLVTSDSGSERSSSVASDCNILDVSNSSNEEKREEVKLKQKKDAAGPLDALLQLSQKDFDDKNGEFCLHFL